MIDTSRPAPADLCDTDAAEVVAGASHRVDARSVVVLFAGR